MKFRVIKLETHDAYTNMGIDEALMTRIGEGKSPPTIRFYKWNPSAVSIGRFQSMEDEVDIQKCDAESINYIRRITGGGAVYHDFNGEITYSIIAPENYFPKGIRESYKFICGWIVNGLKEIGITAEFVPINDITANGKKISGNAQTRKNGVLLQHGTILYGLDVVKMFNLLKVSKEKISDKMIKSVEERVTCIEKLSNASQDDLYNALLKGFTDGKEFEYGDLTEDEKSDAEQFANSIYKSKGWNFSR